MTAPPSWSARWSSFADARVRFAHLRVAHSEQVSGLLVRPLKKTLDNQTLAGFRGDEQGPQDASGAERGDDLGDMIAATWQISGVGREGERRD